MLTDDVAVQRDQRIDGVIVRRRRRRGQHRGPLGDRAPPSPVLDVDGRPRIAPQVVGLGTRLVIDTWMARFRGSV
jgi:hypothetical protein